MYIHRDIYHYLCQMKASLFWLSLLRDHVCVCVCVYVCIINSRIPGIRAMLIYSNKETVYDKGTLNSQSMITLQESAVILQYSAAFITVKGAVVGLTLLFSFKTWMVADNLTSFLKGQFWCGFTIFMKKNSYSDFSIGKFYHKICSISQGLPRCLSAKESPAQQETQI